MKRQYPKHVFPRGAKLYIKVKLPSGKWKMAATGLGLDQGREAGELQRRTQERLDSGQSMAAGPPTVAEWAKTWLEARESQGTITSIADDKGRIKNHLLTTSLARMTITDVRPRHVRAWVHSLRETVRAPRTVRNIAGVVSTMFTDAVIEEHIAATPYVLRRGDLPPVEDADPEWRADAIYTRNELERIISAPEVPLDRRVLYALAFLTGGRAGEVLALRWRNWTRDLEPLGRLVIARSYNVRLKIEKRTKTRAVRKVPVHRVLASMLARWHLSGWEQAHGRKPTPDDLIVPSSINAERSRNVGAVKLTFDNDLTRLKLRVRRLHDARRTFRSLCADDGGSERAIHWIVYGRASTNSARYDEPTWEAICDPVLKLKIQPLNNPLGAFGAADDRQTETDRHRARAKEG